MSADAGTGALLVRYDEISLKGGNRGLFERLLRQNLERALRGTPGLRVQRIHGRLLVRAAAPPGRLAGAAARVFGVASLSAALEVGRDPEEMYRAAHELTRSALRHEFAGLERVPFRVAVNRADKTFPRRAQDLEREFGRRLLEACPALQVQLDAPLLAVEIDIRHEGQWVFAGRLPGPGGLPVGSLGRAMCLLSGGIDSPVAAWLAMKRGLRLEFASFYSFPHVGPQYREKILRLVQHLSEWHGPSVLHLVPFAPLQEAIRDRCPPAYRTVLYRRAMHRIAAQLAHRRRCHALVTGESLGQVASQTLENMALIEAAADLPVLRPVVTCDKQEIVARARQIGSYELSLLPAPDGCTVFQPDHPVLHGTRDEAAAAEAALDLEALTWDAIRRTERRHFPETS